ncbi:uncharacterized protein LOC143617492 [Bidens hawaiensis]|uniref:uncharacterized protein LOC143617492 n=1 Tax=Bidens hawaiensis TaxID=980011 RepID=UPI00404B1673
MDDLVIESDTNARMLKDTKETFKTLRQISMKLNPGKCSFGMEEGKFLGVIVTNVVFKANPEKIEAVMKMPSPRTIKQFRWTVEAKKAFQEIKACLAELPTLAAPQAKEPLVIYLAASERAISTVVMVERDGVQTPIYYSTKPELSRRLARWAIELGEYAIEYKPRPSIKGQVLADFIADVPQGKEEECRKEMEPPVKQHKEHVCKLFTEEASNDEGAGVGLRIINPEGQNFTYAISLEFKNTNNEAEYEALLAGLRISKKLGTKHLEAHVDSMLVANQIECTYDAKDEKMASYLLQAKALMETFATCKVVKRSENKQADALSQLVSVSFEHLAKVVRVEVLANPSTNMREVCVCSTTKPSWMTPIINYLSLGTLPDKKAEARKIHHKALNYTLQNGILYRRSYLGPLLRCVEAHDVNYLLREVHEGIYGVYVGP